ncbi:MAG: HD domain-containing protein [Sedimentisphaerales bacterium]|jgi:3'-5' exoribonuclease|nr:HD domain-containing protein [Sedimentisphaerales bacterium]HNY76645.1 HD domain-containing protein [Sedimentisphaerales bacterium]HOC61748.1 HD domain-containing protein [Sedimentisphaerales bacterium]HOH62580.1 HD domain-containing protein [Sedimentisphaerales bacterium]HQA88437.1 HD domain-containing protein [Sedimentisphaerales bacterium]
MAHKFINEIGPAEPINDIYLVRDPILRSTTKGDLYIAMFLCDRTGQLNGRMWQASELVYKSLPKPGFVHVKGRSELYQNNLQIVINTITPIDPSKVTVEDFLPRTTGDVTKMFAEVGEIVGEIQNADLKALTAAFLTDEEMMDSFCAAPGGMKMHHGCIGGLLEHTHNMLRVARAILPLYPHVQRDLVLAGVFLHDIGKTEELSYDMAFSYTDSGQLIGHINKTLLMIHRKADQLRSEGVTVSPEVLDALGHIILSHHGQHEFGSPKLPATAEAFMVYYIDDLDAKMDQVHAAIEGEVSDANWTAFQGPLQTRLYRKRLD